ncbi:MAG: PAS domain-containing protein [Bacteroidales bacterium]|nr:PAS domain-containing protein [Bacteroidales bacterium]
MKYRNLESHTGKKYLVIIIYSFVLLCILSILNELLDLPHIVLGATSTPINWKEIIIEIFFFFLVFLIAIYILRKVELNRKLAEKNFKLLSQAVNSSIDGLSICNLNNKITYVNKAFTKMFGYSKKELISKKIDFIYQEDQVSILKKTMKSTMKNGWTGELIGKRKDGTLFPMEISASKIMDDKGKAIAHSANHKDITERKRNEEALREFNEKYKILFEKAIDGIFVLDAETMKIVLANLPSAEMYGFESVEDVIGLNPINFIHPEDRERVIKIIAIDMFEKNLQQIDEYRTITKDGKEVWISAMGTRIQYQKKLAGLISIRDITKRKQAEEELKKKNKELKIFNKIAVNRELRIIELKKDINELLTKLNKKTKYIW